VARRSVEKQLTSSVPHQRRHQPSWSRVHPKPQHQQGHWSPSPRTLRREHQECSASLHDGVTSDDGCWLFSRLRVCLTHSLTLLFIGTTARARAPRVGDSERRRRQTRKWWSEMQMRDGNESAPGAPHSSRDGTGIPPPTPVPVPVALAVPPPGWGAETSVCRVVSSK
jgi:hypothetical protein